VIIRKRNPDRFSRFSTADARDLQTDRPRYTAVTTGRILATTHSDAAWRCSRSRLLVRGGAAIVHELSGSCVGGLALRVNCSSGVLWQRGLLALLLEWTGRRFIFLGTCTCCAPAWAAAARTGRRRRRRRRPPPPSGRSATATVIRRRRAVPPRDAQSARNSTRPSQLTLPRGRTLSRLAFAIIVTVFVAERRRP